MLGLDVYFVANANRRWREAVSVGGELVAFLRNLDLVFEHRVEFFEVDSVAVGLNRRNVAFGVYRDVGVVAFVRKEGGDAGRRARRVIVRKFGEGKEFGPVVLLVVAIDSNVLFQGFIRGN